NVGKILVIAGGVVDVLGPTLAQSAPQKVVPILIVGTSAGIVGYLLRTNAKPSDDFWRATLAQMKLRETKSAEVRDCLLTPSATSSSGAEEIWTYYTQSVGLWRIGGSTRSVIITFKNGVLANIRRSESGF